MGDRSGSRKIVGRPALPVARRHARLRAARHSQMAPARHSRACAARRPGPGRCDGTRMRPTEEAPMTIQVGDKLPAAKVRRLTPDGIKEVSLGDLDERQEGGAVRGPSRVTPTCSARHLPGFIEQAGALKAKGVDPIACVAVNDPFVLDAWAKSKNVGDKVSIPTRTATASSPGRSGSTSTAAASASARAPGATRWWSTTARSRRSWSRRCRARPRRAAPARSSPTPDPTAATGRRRRVNPSGSPPAPARRPVRCRGGRRVL